MRKILLFFLFPLLTSIPSWGNSVPKYEGRIEINPEVMHSEAIKGKIMLLFGEENFNAVELILDKKVFGKDTFNSNEQSLIIKRKVVTLLEKTGIKSNEEITQLSAVFSLNKTPHKWYFVFSTSPENGLLKGIIFKVMAEMSDILAILETGFEETPESWKEIGTLELNEKFDG